jgi:hypothetical protein
MPPRDQQLTRDEAEHLGSDRDPEEDTAERLQKVREKNLDKTLADSFPTSDPSSSIPGPIAAQAPSQSRAAFGTLIGALPPGSWAVISEDGKRVVATGATREEAVQNAGGTESQRIRVVRVPQDPDAPEQAA